MSIFDDNIHLIVELEQYDDLVEKAYRRMANTPTVINTAIFRFEIWWLANKPKRQTWKEKLTRLLQRHTTKEKAVSSGENERHSLQDKSKDKENS